MKDGEETHWVQPHPSYIDQLRKLAQTMKIASKCGLGQSVANPFISIVDHFREEIIF